jgi:hypothetical protein
VVGNDYGPDRPVTELPEWSKIGQQAYAAERTFEAAIASLRNVQEVWATPGATVRDVDDALGAAAVMAALAYAHVIMPDAPVRAFATLRRQHCA